MTLDLITFSEIAGARVYYPPNGLKPRKVRLSRHFHAVLEACLEDLWQRCPWGRAEWLGSLGCYVPSTPDHDTGRHDIGEAVDVSDLLWPDGGPGSSVSSDDPGLESRGDGRKRLAHYLAVEAVFRLHFQTVLDWWHPDGDGKYRHRDHFHIDCGRGSPTWEGRKNQVRFLQASIRYIWGAEGLAIDGDFGPKTRAETLSCWPNRWWDGERLSFEWTAFLEETARRGFAS